MWSLDDTIAAIATPPGEGGIGIVKVSGPAALRLLQRLWASGHPAPEATPPPAAAEPWPPRQMRYGAIRHPINGRLVDEVLAVWMPAPHTYTCQDVVEVQCHGGLMATRAVLALLLQAGARLAEPGEMTLRAFLGGRIDLAQAEAVLGVVQANTELGLQVAAGQLAGSLSSEIRRLRAPLLNVLAHLEGSIDFPEDEIPACNVPAQLAEVQVGLQGLLTEAETGVIYRQGIRTAIVGRPNVGKSSLLNALLRVERAIVTAIPGTTRDTLEETLNVRGVPLVLVDTAGLQAESPDPIEQLGMARSRAALAEADLVLWVVDGSQPLGAGDFALHPLLQGKPCLVVVNKSDLPPRTDGASLLPQAPHLAVSAVRGTGLEALQEAILQQVLGGAVQQAPPPRVSQVRHQTLLRLALTHLEAAMEAQSSGLPTDCVTIDVNGALQALGQISGETVSEDLLQTIFSQFCLGK
ncbi:MAG: tRNA uridine-5-carboxymethylaminomethyl(34) synthesis GTPase MnmE [Chloroflexi bacterium]|nr:tRNA uridine-5-carboxymethylaminomethyl(34) synthesis GTPase MnmE [Chloroflexota bacterium]